MAALHSYPLLIRWQFLRLRQFLPIMVIVQALLAFGIVAGYPLLFPELDQGTILFLATGAPAIALITMGLVLVPQVVSAAKAEGSLDYVRTLPVPRMTFLLADLTVWSAIVLPGVAFGVVVAAIRFGLDLTVSPLVVPAFALVALTASCVGYALASFLPPTLTALLSQALVVFVLMFSPLVFPAERLPGWLQVVHDVLPIQAMGEVIRGTLASTVFTIPAGSFALLGAWCVIGFGIAFVTLNRRG
jgi:ABC-2 type transport system permease protein